MVIFLVGTLRLHGCMVLQVIRKFNLLVFFEATGPLPLAIYWLNILYISYHPIYIMHLYLVRNPISTIEYKFKIHN